MSRYLQLGSAGPEVGELHQQLLEAGESVPQDELSSSIFGPGTDLAVRAAQTAAGLHADGIVGEKTRAALEHPNTLPGTFDEARYTKRDWRCRLSEVRAEVRPVVEAALLDLARPVVEDPPGSNRGPHVDRYGVPGLAWCGAAVSHWFHKADGDPLKGARLASAYKWREWAKENGRVLAPSDAVEPGDVLLVIRKDLHGHVGLAVHVDGAPGREQICSIEGNVQNAVRGLVRFRCDWTLAVRPIKKR